MIGSNKKSVLHSGIFLEQKTARLRINRRNMPSQESVTDAKQKFINAVMEGTSVLMERCGYSRERATSALLRELSRGEFDVIRPTDEEVSDMLYCWLSWMAYFSRIIQKKPSQSTVKPVQKTTIRPPWSSVQVPRGRCNREQNDWSHSAGLTVRNRLSRSYAGLTTLSLLN